MLLQDCSCHMFMLLPYFYYTPVFAGRVFDFALFAVCKTPPLPAMLSSALPFLLLASVANPESREACASDVRIV